MNNKLIMSGLIAVACATNAFAASNPVAEFYPDGYPAWTDNIDWSNVIDMKTDGRITAVSGEWARFEKGVELLGPNGGVLYYPAGVYSFTDIPAGENGAKPDGQGIMLRSGVVLMGEKPTSRQLASEIEGGKINLGTVFEFPVYDRKVTGVNDQEVIKKTPGHWNFVGLKTRPGQELKDVDNVGICFINFKNGGLYWGAQYEWAQSYQDPARISYGAAGCDADKGWMPTRVADGTHYADPFSGCLKKNIDGEEGSDYQGAGSGRLVLACRFDDAVLLDAGGYNGNYKDGENNGQERNFQALALDPYRFGARITIDASNVFIASTAITKPTNAFLYKAWLLMPPGDPVGDRYNQSMMLNVPQLFDPAKHIGIDVGKGILGLVSKAQRHKLDDFAPFYEPNIVIRDCYVYNHGHKGYEVSGRWVKVFNNVNDRDYLGGGSIPNSSSPDRIDHIGDAKKVYGLTDKISYKLRSAAGTTTVEGAEGHYIARLSSLRGTNQTDDNMSRAFDMGGHNVWIDNNRYWATGSWPGNDGEGILGQRSGEIEAFSWATTNNNAILVDNPWPDSGYMATYDMHTVGALWYANQGRHPAWNAGPTGMKISGSNQAAEIAVINNILADGKPGSGDGRIDFSTSGPSWNTASAPTSGVKAPSNVKAVRNETAGYVEISWNPDYVINGSEVTDNSNEVGYRVERRREGSDVWTVVAYRPMQTGHKILTGVNRTLNGKSSWTLEEMDLNPAAWRDYERLDGVAEYRVVALGVTTEDDQVQTEAPVKVDFGVLNGLNFITAETTEMRLYVTNNMVICSDIATSINAYDITGKLVSRIDKSDRLNLSDLNSGIYIITAEKDGLTSTIKIVKK